MTVDQTPDDGDLPHGALSPFMATDQRDQLVAWSTSKMLLRDFAILNSFQSSVRQLGV